LEGYARIAHYRERHAPHLGAVLHRGEHVARTQQQLAELFRTLLVEVADTSRLRDDVEPDELARYCLHALAAAGGLPGEAAVRRLVTGTLAGLRPSAAR